MNQTQYQMITDNRKSQILELKKQNPTRTLEDIGKEVGLSRQRVYQVLTEEGVATHKTHPTCDGCGIVLQPSKKRPYIAPNGNRYCTICREQMVYGTYTCTDCGSEVRRRRKSILRSKPKSIFCNKKCQGHYLGVTYGRKSRSG